MKKQRIQTTIAVIAVAGMAFLATNALAQNSPVAAPPTATTVAAPPMTSGASEILRMAQAKISDDTILAYVKNSGTGYSLNADQIIYLSQQGVSTTVLNAMLSQSQPAAAPAPAVAAAPQPTAPASQPVAVPATAAPAVTYVQTVPSTTYYYASPYYYPAYYGGYYGWGYPAVSLSFGWGGRWGGGWGHGGWGHGGWHR